MKKKLMTGIVVGSIVFSGCQMAFGQEVIWKYSEENMEKTYVGKWVDSSANIQFFLPTEGWEADTSGLELTEETETEGYPEVLGTETEAETAAGIETEAAETMTGRETDSDIAAGNETAAGSETESETEAETEPVTSEYALRQPSDGMTVRLYHLETDDLNYPSIQDIRKMFNDNANVYLVECNEIKAVHFDTKNTENLAFPEIVGNEEEGYVGSVAVLSVGCRDREERELFADELFSSVKIREFDDSIYLEDGLIRSYIFIDWQVKNAAEKYVRLLSHKKFFSNEGEDEPDYATGFALVDMDDDGMMELLVQYKGSNPSTEDSVMDYALYTFSEGEERLLQTMEGLGQDDWFGYYPGMRLLEYDTYYYDDYDGTTSYDCYQYDGKEIIYLDYDEIDWDQAADGVCLSADDFIIPNTEENQETITERMQETMDEHMWEG